MATPIGNNAENSAYVSTGLFDATKATGATAVITTIAGAIFAAVETGSDSVSEPVVIAVLGVVGIALIAAAIVVAADLLARSRLQVAKAAAEAATDAASTAAVVATEEKPPQNGNGAIHMTVAEGGVVKLAGPSSRP